MKPPSLQCVPAKWMSQHSSFGSLALWLFRTACAAYGSSQGRGWSGTAAAGLHHSHSNVRSEPRLWPTPHTHGNARSLTHWARPGIETATSLMLLRFLTAKPQWELLLLTFFNKQTFIRHSVCAKHSIRHTSSTTLNNQIWLHGYKTQLSQE